jgi:hypothetical protein
LPAAAEDAVQEHGDRIARMLFQTTSRPCVPVLGAALADQVVVEPLLGDALELTEQAILVRSRYRATLYRADAW